MKVEEEGLVCVFEEEDEEKKKFVLLRVRGCGGKLVYER